MCVILWIHQFFLFPFILKAELVEADTMLQKAYAVLKRSLSFVQAGNTGASNKAMDDAKNALTALSTIIESIGADAESQQKIKLRTRV